MSVGVDGGAQMVLNFSEGKGGGFFFWSVDRRLMVKTLESNEARARLPAFRSVHTAQRAHLAGNEARARLPAFRCCGSLC